MAIIKESVDQIAKQISKAITEHYKDIFVKAEKPIRQAVGAIFKRAVLTHPIVQEVIHVEEIRGALGVDSPQGRFEVLIDIWIDHMFVKGNAIHSFGNRITGSLEFGIVIEDYSDVLNSSPANLLTHTRFPPIPWLEWLLTAADEARVVGYVVEFGSFPSSSRTGLAIMRKKDGAVWRSEVKPNSPNDNFITQSLDNISDDVISIIKREVQKQL